jgi:integrase
MKNERKLKIEEDRLLPNGRKGEMRKSTETTLVETVEVNGHSIEIRRYDLGGKIEFRFPWRDQNGKRHFRCCRTLEEAIQSARSACSGQVVATSNGPVDSPGLTPEQLAEAARLLGVPASRVTAYDLTFSEVCDQFLEAKRGKLQRGEIRAPTCRELECRIADLKELLGKDKMGHITADRMDKAMSKLALSPRSISNCRDALRAVLRWAVNRDKAPDSVLRAFNAMMVTGSKAKDAEKIDPFKVGEVTALLNEARNHASDNPGRGNCRLAITIALQAFAGLRAAESWKLPWECIDLIRGVIRVPAEIAKTKRARTVEILPCLHKWLETVPLQGRHGPAYTGWAYSKAQGRLARRVAQKLDGFRWRDNALRQAFVANYIALKDSISEAAYVAGNSEAKIRSNYWRLVSRDEAVAYFGIEPM